MAVVIKYRLDITPTKITEAAKIALQEEAQTIVAIAKSNTISMGIFDSGRQHDSIQAVMRDWKTIMGAKAKSEDALDIPVAKLGVNIGSGTPYAATNEFGNESRSPRPAIRNAVAMVDSRVFGDSFFQAITDSLTRRY